VTPKRTPTPASTPSVLPARSVSVQVLNGTARNGLARETANKIKAVGYRITGTGNAPRRAKSTIFYKKGSRDEALALQEQFPEFTVVTESSATGGAMLRVVIGADYP
jgi:hypothetical protein